MKRALSVQRQFGADAINAVANHLDVRPWVGGTGPIDLAPIIADPRNYVLMREGGGCVFQCLAEGYYEVHTQFVPTVAGADVLRAVKDALWFMFTATDAVEIVTKVPDGNLAATGLVRSIKGTFQFHRPNAWQNPDGSLTGVKYFSKTLSEWVKDETDALSIVGEDFHLKLAEAKARMGASNSLHDDDHAHDRYVGMACEMIARGQLFKAQVAYGRWATFAGYAQFAILSANPVLLDIQDAILLVKGDDFEVIACR